jgi:hypothetical protein
MARTKTGTPPSHPSKPRKGQARITVRLADGRRKGIYLGAFGSPESRKEYQRVLAELEAGGSYPVAEDGRPACDLTVAELLLRFWGHAKAYYRLADGSPSRELEHYQLALRPVLELYGPTPAGEFGPLALKAVRQRLLGAEQYRVRLPEGPQKGRWVGEAKVRPAEPLAWLGDRWRPVEVLGARPALSRKVINQRIDHVKRVFAWAVSEQLLPAAVHDALSRVPGPRRGHQGTFDHPKVKPVPDGHVEATLPYLAPQVVAMVQLQRLTGARSVLPRTWCSCAVA